MSAIAVTTGDSVLDPELFRVVCDELVRISGCVVGGDGLAANTDLIAGLGLNSLKLVDLTVALEDVLELSEFPMQEWVDAQAAAGRPLTVGELAFACEALVKQARA